MIAHLRIQMPRGNLAQRSGKEPLHILYWSKVLVKKLHSLEPDVPKHKDNLFNLLCVCFGGGGDLSHLQCTVLEI